MLHKTIYKACGWVNLKVNTMQYSISDDLKFTGVHHLCTFQVQLLISKNLAQKQIVFNSLIIHYLVMITYTSYENAFVLSPQRCLINAPL